MSWIDDLMTFGGDLVENIGENFASAYGTALGGGDRTETLAQPEVNQQREPVKGVDVDGRPLVSQHGTAGGQWINGVNNGVVLAGGAVLILGLALLLKGGR